MTIIALSAVKTQLKRRLKRTTSTKVLTPVEIRRATYYTIIITLDARNEIEYIKI